MDWQPFETAPKDGTEVLLWNEETGMIEIGEFVNGQWSDGAHYFSMEDGFDNLTHWMPLPPPPS